MSILAIGLVLVWGEAGILTLGQGVFFGLGGYAIAMHLKLVALDSDILQTARGLGICLGAI